MDKNSSQRSNAFNSFNAFTLIELLVVISVIAILAAMLLPAISMIRDSARQVVCVSSTRQIALGIVGYSNDHESYLPMGQIEAAVSPTGVDLYWADAIADYLDAEKPTGNGVDKIVGIFEGCPSRKACNGWVMQAASHAGKWPAYAYNDTPLGDNGRQGPGTNPSLRTNPGQADLYATWTIPITQVGALSKRAVISDGDGMWREMACFFFQNNGATEAQLKTFHGRHRGRVACAYYDGHASALKPYIDVPGTTPIVGYQEVSRAVVWNVLSPKELTTIGWDP